MSSHKTGWQQTILQIWQGKGLVSTLLLPASWLYGALLRLNQARRHRQAVDIGPRPPIVVVGNLVVGGTGKTPTVIALTQALTGKGWRPGIISRGYGVDIGSQARTGQGELQAEQFGDEPALIARATHCPIAVHPKRVQALQALLRDFPSVNVVIADDGLQHLALPRDLIVIVQDARGLGNGRLLPAGPLREPASRLRDAHTLVTNLTAQGIDASAAAAPLPPETQRTDTSATAQAGREVIMRLQAVSVTQLTTGRCLPWSDWLALQAGRSAAALAAIGQPARFFAMLQQQGLTLAQTLALPDHAPLDADSLKAMQADSVLVTEKDAIKSPHCLDERVWSVQVRPVFSDPAWVDAIAAALCRTGGQDTASGITLDA